MKVAILLKIARQVEGEFVFVNVLKAHMDADKLYRYVRQSQLPLTEKIGDVDCVIEYGVIEDIEVEEEEQKNERQDPA